MQTSSPLPTPQAKDLDALIKACLANGQRMLDDIQVLEFSGSAPTRLMLAMLAQEEFAKAFLLFLVKHEIIPWDAELRQVMRDHACKHLVGIVIEYLDPQWDTLDDLRAMIDAEYALNGVFPKPVSTALNILYWEKIRRGNFFDDDNDYDPAILRIAKGARDKEKQNAVYIDVGRTGQITKSPINVTPELAEAELKKADRYCWFVGYLAEYGPKDSIQFEKLQEALKIVYWQRYKPVSPPEETA